MAAGRSLQQVVTNPVERIGRVGLAELRRRENVVLQQLEQNCMAKENQADERAASEREPLKDSRPSNRPLPQNGPPIFNHGLESPRSSNC
jgi:hypothetical protein